jgi:hypothetical protein
MKRIMVKCAIVFGLAVAGWLWSWGPTATGGLVATAQAVVGAPATPVSYAGVARRTTVRAATPGVGAPGVGVTPGVGVGAPGVGAAPANRGGPVNRVGVR